MRINIFKICIKIEYVTIIHNSVFLHAKKLHESVKRKIGYSELALCPIGSL